MILVKIPVTHQESEVKALCQYLKAVADNSKSTVEALRELAENEFINEDMFIRLVEGEKKCLLDEIQNYIDLYRGIN